MRLAISNIAWDPAEDEQVAAVLRRHAIDAIDVAPGKYFPRPHETRPDEVAAVRSWWRDRGIEITGMQGLLFGVAGLNLFGPSGSRAAMMARLRSVCRIAGGLGARRLVFGSPKNRDRGGLDDGRCRDLAVAFFRELGEVAAAEGVLVCLEPVPARYGANFMTGSAETAAIVEAVGHEAIRMQLDTGAMSVNGEDGGETIRRFASLFGHIHASEPDLLPLGDGGCPHRVMAEAIRDRLPGFSVCIEMAATAAEPHPRSVERAVAAALRHYGGEPGERS